MRFGIALAALIAAAPTVALANSRCDAALRDQLIAPAEAKRLHVGSKRVKDGTSQVYVCYQARTRGGGYAKVGGICEMDAKGGVMTAEVPSNSMIAGMYCDLARKQSQ